MDTYKFSLKFNNDDDSLTRTNGLSILELGQLIIDLSNAMGQEDMDKCVLFEVKDSSQAFDFLSNSEKQYAKFVQIHQNIEERSISDLEERQAKYAKTLRKALRANLYCEAINNDGAKIVKLYSRDIQKEVEHYFAIKTVSGIISEMGGQSLDTQPHILLHGLSYRVLITQEQDKELRGYYRQQGLTLRVKQKISLAKNNVMSATLLNFSAKPQKNLLENLYNLNKDDLSIFPFNSNEDILNALR